MEHDSPALLFRLACEHLITERVLRPGPVKLLERVAAARARAERETYDRVAHLLTVSMRAELDRLLVVNRELGMTRLRWLSTGPTEASAAAVKIEVRKLEFLRGLDAHTLDLSTLPAERRRHLAAVGRRSSVPALTRREPHRRYPIVLTLLAQSAVDVLDEVVQLFDQAVTARESRARHKLADQLAERAKHGEDKLALAEVILPVLADPAIADEQVGGLLRERIGMSRLAAALATPTTTRLPRDHGHLAVIDASYGYLRQFTPDVLRVLSFAGGPVAASLLEAVEVLRELNASGARTVPAGAPTEFVPARWRGYLDDATAIGNTSAYRHYWELCVLLCLRDALRSGDVHVPGSRRYADPTAYLIAPEAWPAQRGEFCALVGVPAAPDAALARAQGELVYKRVSTDQQSTDRQNLVLDEAGIEDPVVFEEESGTSSRLHPLERPKFGDLLTYARPGDTVHISEMFRLVRGTGHILDVLDVLHRDQVALRIHDGAFSGMDLTARHPRTGELLSTVKFMVQTLAAAGELQRDLQRELTYDGLRAAEAKGNKGGRRPVLAGDTVTDVRAAYLEGQSIAALGREYSLSRGAIRTAVADLLPEHVAAAEPVPAPELPVTLDMPGKVADFLRTTELEPAQRAALDQGATVRRGQGYTLRVTAVLAVHHQLLARCQPLDGAQGVPAIPAQRKARREYENRVSALTG